MMATTHALFGMVLAAVVATVAPEFGTVALVAGVAGGAFPDLDLYAGHRKTLHYPVYFAVGALAAAAVAVAVPSAATVGVAVFVTAAAAHSLMDALGGGLELRPWHATSEEGVYDHARGQWIEPRRWIRYDGAPEDLALAATLALPGLAAFGTRVHAFVAAVLGVSAVYTLLRRRMVTFVEWLVDRVPDDVLGYVPDGVLGDYA